MTPIVEVVVEVVVELVTLIHLRRGAKYQKEKTKIKQFS